MLENSAYGPAHKIVRLMVSSLAPRPTLFVHRFVIFYVAQQLGCIRSFAFESYQDVGLVKCSMLA